MFIICSGKTSNTLATICKKDLDIPVLGVDLDSLYLTIENRGIDHFKDVKKIIITDGALNSLLEVNNLNKLEGFSGEIYFLNRYAHVTKNNDLISEIKQINVKEVQLETIKGIILGGEI